MESVARKFTLLSGENSQNEPYCADQALVSTEASLDAVCGYQGLSSRLRGGRVTSGVYLIVVVDSNTSNTSIEGCVCSF